MMENSHGISEELPVGDADAANLAQEEMEEMEEIYSRAVRNTRIRFSLYIHSLVFAVVMSILLVINLMTSSYWWVVWPFFGWGLGLGIHWFAATKMVQMYDALKEKEIARQLDMRKPR